MNRTAALTTLTLAVALAGCGEAEVTEENIGVAEEIEPGVEARAEGFADLDANADQRLDETEFGGWLDSVYESWDLDDDNAVGADEYATGTFAAWDRDYDGRLMPEEWQRGTERWFGDAVEPGTFEEWDADLSGALDAGEARLPFERLSQAWDANRDARLDTGELEEGVWGLYDENDDLYIDANEWDSEAWDWGI